MNFNFRHRIILNKFITCLNRISRFNSILCTQNYFTESAMKNLKQNRKNHSWLYTILSRIINSFAKSKLYLINTILQVDLIYVLHTHTKYVIVLTGVKLLRKCTVIY